MILKTIKSILNQHQPIIKKINKQIHEITDSNYSLINTATSDLVSGGGKRLRPLILILSASFNKFNENKIIKLAAGIEILHMSTLVHDDIIDEAKIRRNQQTAQKKFGKDMAVFLGDYFLSRVFNIFVSNLSKKSLTKLSKIMKLLCEGEIGQYQNKYNTEITLPQNLKRIRPKTALLYALRTYVGAYESGMRNKPLYHLYNFGLNLGMAFQIKDDLLDFEGKENILGKDEKQDLKEGIYTLPIILLIQNQKNNQIQKILKKDNLTVDDITYISQQVKNKSMEKSKTIMQKFIDKAKQHLQALPDHKAKQYLEEIINTQSIRKY